MRSLRWTTDRHSEWPADPRYRRHHRGPAGDTLSSRAAAERGLRAIHEAAKGQDGINAALTLRPDCILLDYHMPDMSGLDVLHDLRDGSGEVAFAVVMMTGGHDEAVITAALRAGAQDYVSKARIEAGLLERTVRGAIDRFALLSAQRKLEARFRAIVTNSTDAIVSIDPAGIIDTWNAGAERMFGWSTPEAVGRNVRELTIPPDRLPEFESAWQELQAGRSVHLETARVSRQGDRLDASVTLTPLFENSRLVAASSITRDTTQIRRSEERVRFLMDELSHRFKNLLAVIQALATQTGRNTGSTEEFLTSFQQRLNGLAASMDLLVNENGTGVPIAQLVRSQLASFAEIDGVRVIAEGPVRLLRPDAAQSLGLALHELATNAVKYGSLSVPEGTTEIRWEVDHPETADPRLRVRWHERNGPKVLPPRRKGFGHMVIERMVGQALGGKVELDFAPAGVSWRLDVPADVTLPA